MAHSNPALPLYLKVDVPNVVSALCVRRANGRQDPVNSAEHGHAGYHPNGHRRSFVADACVSVCMQAGNDNNNKTYKHKSKFKVRKESVHAG